MDNQIYLDKNGIQICDDDILYDGTHYWSYATYGTMGKDKDGNRMKVPMDPYLFACTYGYQHDLSAELFDGMEIVGNAIDTPHLLECD